MSSNNRKLKLGFAMGGGVSLGSFSGAALSEVIRQAVLYGEYDEIEIDVFAGASAGSMSLAIMLRGLAYQTKKEIETATTHLRKELGAKFDQLPDKKKENLIAAQVVQDLQYDIWVNEINIFKLLGIDENTKAEIEDLTYEAGFVRRNALVDIARKFFNFKLEEEDQVDFKNRKLLGKRVLFASTLTNLTPVKVDARSGTEQSDHNYSASADAFTSNTHREVRVFDLSFEKLNVSDVEDPFSYPRKWVRYHTGKKSSGAFGDLNTLAPWSKIVSTSIACGAFPFAFEPVVLKRYEYEYDKWPAEIEDLGLQSDAGSAKWYPYTYVDGGTMNNEPVREAFRLAAFQDADEAPGFDRVIVFVDPFLGEEGIDYRVPIHKQYFMQDPFQKWASALDGFDLEKSPTLNRLLAHVGTMLGVLTDQVRNNENDKIYDTLELFKDQKEYCNPIFSLIEHLPEAEVDAQLIMMTKKLDEILKNQQANELLPVGALTLKEELARIKREHPDELSTISYADIDLFCNPQGNQFPPAKRKLFLKAIYALLFNILTGLAGKSSLNKIVAIAPVIHHFPAKSERILLPGSYLAAFSGFFSKEPNKYEVELAKYCARDSLKRSEIIPKNPDGEIPLPPKFSKQQEYENDFAANLKYLKQRIENILKHSKLLNLPLVESIAMPVILKKINRQLDDIQLKQDPVDKFLFYIPVEDPGFEIDGIPHNSDADAIKEELSGKKGYYIITELSYQWNEQRWYGAHVKPSGQFLIQKAGILDKDICWINLPARDTIAKVTFYPNPIFTLRNPITKKDKDKTFLASEWIIDPGVKPLEDILLCD